MPETKGDSTDEGRDVLFEETLSMGDEEGASSLVTRTRIVLVFLVLAFVSTVLAVVAATRLLASTVGDVGALLSVVYALVSDRPVLAGGGFLLIASTVVVGFALSIVAFVRRLDQLFDQSVHVRVTDRGVTVEREGSQYWQSAGEAVPFDAITAVEYLDPDESSTRIELRDARSRQFFAGRSRSWVRIERSDDATVFIGSDRPNELAETVAGRAPGVENADPF